MTQSTPEMIVSGVSYTVVQVEGRTPAGLDDFVGTKEFVVEGLTGTHTIHGEGSTVDETVRVHQKTEGLDQKDLRVWTVHAGAEGGFQAEC
jgi:hypothetical protein